MATGYEPVTELEKCTWNESGRSGNAFWKALSAGNTEVGVRDPVRVPP